MRARWKCLAAASTLMIAQSAAAQSLHSFELGGEVDSRATVAVTIPLGGNRSSSETTPRVEFSLQSQRISTATAPDPFRFDSYRRDQFAIQQTNFALTFERNPRLLLNGQRVATYGPRLTADEDDGEGGGGPSTGVIVVGVLVAAAVAGTVFTVTDIRDGISDLTDPD